MPSGIAHSRDDVEVAHVTGEVSHELGHVDTCVGEPRNEPEAARHIAASDEVGDLEEKLGVHLAEQVLDIGEL